MSKRTTGKLPTECPDCHGLGYTRATSAEMETAFRFEQGYVEVKTLQLGSACPLCGGLGQVMSAHHRELLDSVALRVNPRYFVSPRLKPRNPGDVATVRRIL